MEEQNVFFFCFFLRNKASQCTLLLSFPNLLTITVDLLGVSTLGLSEPGRVFIKPPLTPCILPEEKKKVRYSTTA